MTNLRTPAVLIRYGARWLQINLAWLLTVLSVKGADFSALGTSGALVGLALVNVVWVAHVASSVADSGDITPTPPEQPAPTPAPAPPPPAPPVA